MGWYYLTIGSAVWWNVGKSKVFGDHPEATTYFLGSTCKDTGHTDPVPTECEADFPGMYKKAKSKGLDSFQFTEHYDCSCGETGHSSWKSHKQLCLTEMIDLIGKGENACATAGKGNKAGWGASKKCTCDSPKTYANCAGY